ncbi:MAG TPA: hypothetical protein VGI57_10010, partial [Usitatibacter sp.]
MGIKDWFGGDKKKAELREKVKEAVSDGKLDARDLREIEQKRQELGVTPARDDRTVMRRALYNEAVNAAKAGGELTGTDAHELAKIQKFLALRDDQIEKTKWDLQRLRTLTEIRHGNLPLVPSNSSSLRGAQLEPAETAHYSMSVEVLGLPTTRQNDGVRAEWNKAYEQGSAKMHVLPGDGAKPQGDATVILTDKRLILKTESGKVAA